MPRKTKNEWQELKTEREEKTDAEVRESEDIKEDAVESVSDWDEQEEPSLVETAEALNVIAEELGSDIEETHGQQAESVEASLEVVEGKSVCEYG